MTTENKPAKKSLQEQLLDEQNKTKQQAPQEPVKVEPTPRQRIENADLLLKAFQAERELESQQSGYVNFKVRESSIVEREKSIADREEALKKSIGEFEIEQNKRVDKVNKTAEEYNKAYALLKTEREEAKRIMEEAIEKKSQAEQIIKAQTLEQKTTQARQTAYASNMEESLKLFADIYRYLKVMEEPRCLDMAVALNKDLGLIQRLCDKKVNLQTVADIISVDHDRLIELCEFLQNSKKDYSDALGYLFQATEWLQKALILNLDKPK